jgi:acyl-CoA thioester hydrolase
MGRQIETYRGFVYPWSIDHVGHMNVQSYTGRFDEASWHFLAHLGLTPTYFRESKRALVALDQRTQYKLEVLSGSLLDIRTELVELRSKTLRIVHRMRSSETGDLVATMELLAAMIDTVARKTVALPPFVTEKAHLLLPEVVQENCELGV